MPDVMLLPPVDCRSRQVRIYLERHLPRYACWQWQGTGGPALRHGDLIAGWSAWLMLLDVVYPEREWLVRHNVD